ncbi:RTX calcium-binding nonapeptide repeat (4 copies) [compost metagenome]
MYAGNAADYLLGWRDGYLTITDLNRADGDEGSDLLGAIETLQFADRSYSVRPGGETFVNTSIADIQQDPSVTALADGGWLVTWESYKEDDNGWDIHAQRYDASGHRLGGEVLVNTSTADFQQGSAVTALPDGGWLITWESESRRICSQRYDALGNTMGSETLVAITSGSAYPSIATLADGGWLIAWETHNPTAGEFDIYTQRYDAQGNAIGGPAPVAVSQTSHQVLPTVTALADGGWLVAWTSVDQNTWDNDIYMRRFDAQGTASGPDVRVNSTTSDTQHHAAIAALGDGGWLITWNAENQDGSGYGVYAQRYDAQGNPLGGETRVNTTILDDQYNAAVTVLADGGWLVVWQSNNQDGSGYGIYAQRYDAQGNRLGGETQVSTYTDSHQQAPAITTLADGGWLVAWQSHGQDGSSDGIYSQRFDAQGHALQMEVIDASGNHLGILAASDRTLSGQEQNLVLVGYANINGTGNALGNQISGNAGDNRLDAGAGNDILSGGGGSDTLIGGDGADIFLYQNRADSRLGAMDTIGDLSAQDRLNFAGMDGIQLRPGGYTFHGSLAMTLAVIQADTGIANQVVFFSDGIDGYLYLKGAGTGVSFDGTLIKLSGQTTPPTARQLSLAHSIESASTYTLGANDDNLTLSGIANINGTGNNFANWLIGNAGRNTLNGGLGDDRLDGRGGSDKLVGGGGNDTYIVDLIPKGSGAKISIRLEDSISESANAGSDTLQLRGTIATSGYTTLTLASTLENLDASATGNTKLNLTGNKANNVLYGNDADNILDGKVGTDTLIGGAGNDTYVLDSLAEVGLIGELAGGGEADTLRIAYKNKSRSTAEVVDLSTQPNLENIIITGTGLFDLIGNEADNSLIGNASANRLVGGAGNDLLDGQAGADTLTGGAGADLFRFDSLKDLGLGNGRQDVITDFVRGEDKLDFTALVGWRFVEGPPSSGNKQLWFVNDDPAGGTLYGNSGGSAKADFAIKLLGVTELHASDFL